MFEIINLTKEEFYEEEIHRVLKKGVELEEIKEAIFTVILVDNAYIHDLNKTYRGMDRPTDVITFALEDTKDMETVPRMLGDIYVSIEKAKEQAIQYGHSLRREICFLVVHGFYHLLGFDHQTLEEEKIMFARQEALLQSEGITE